MDTSLPTHRSGETDRNALRNSTNVTSRGTPPLRATLVESRWFYLVAGLAITCGPLFIPGVGIREWFVILIGGGVLIYLAILVGGLALQIAGNRGPGNGGRHGR